MADWMLMPVVAFVAVLASGFFSGAEMGVYALNTVRVRVLATRGDSVAARLLKLVERYETVVITALVGTNIADYVATAAVTAMLLTQASSATAAEFYATLIVTPLILVFGNLIPKDNFRRNPDRLMRLASTPLTLFAMTVRWSGLLTLLRGLSRKLLRYFDPTSADESADLRPRTRALKIVREGAERGGLSAFQRDTFERVIGLSRTRVSKVMVPLSKTACVPDRVERDALIELVNETHFSRLPVYRGGRQNVIGVLHVFDVYAAERTDGIKEHIREVLRISASDSVPAALRKLQEHHEVFAIVEDRRGNALGVLTIKDLVEEIVGELEVW